MMGKIAYNHRPQDVSLGLGVEGFVRAEIDSLKLIYWNANP